SLDQHTTTNLQANDNGSGPLLPPSAPPPPEPNSTPLPPRNPTDSPGQLQLQNLPENGANPSQGGSATANTADAEGNDGELGPGKRNHKPIQRFADTDYSV
ncbi:hypothetical protein PQX77_014936, partial [Marasmius sp. AFHP31]